MNVSVDYIRPRMADDPGDADYMTGISQISGIRWEIPVTKEELEKMQRGYQKTCVPKNRIDR